VAEYWRITLIIVIAFVWIMVCVAIPRRAWTTSGGERFLDDAPLSSARGGAVWSWYFLFGRATTPFVRIEVHQLGLMIRSSTCFFSWYIPSSALLWSELASVRKTQGGVMIRTKDRPGFLRLSTNSGSLFSQIEALGVQVN
jgi:hypothetical protein